MSGRKRISVDEAEWNRLRRQASSLANVQTDLPRLISQVQQQASRDIERSSAEAAARAATTERAIEELSATTVGVERDTQRRIAEQRARADEQIDRQRAELRDVASGLRAQHEGLRRTLDEERAARAREMAAVRTEMSTLRDSQERSGELAEAFLRDAEVQRAQIAALPHERFVPGELAALERRLATVHDSVDRGLAAHSLAGAQALYHDLSDLRSELEWREHEWRTWRDAAVTQLLVVAGLAEQNGTLALPEEDRVPGEPAPDVDHWSHGGLTQLRDDVAAELARVRDEERPLSTEELEAVVARGAPDFRERLDEVVTRAATEIYASQLRANIAGLIADALDRDHQYEVTEGDYVEDDQRATFRAHTEHHASRSEIVIEVEPGDDGRPVVHLHSFDGDGASDAERMARARAIGESVRANGIDMEEPTEDGRPDERLSRRPLERDTGTAAPDAGPRITPSVT